MRHEEKHQHNAFIKAQINISINKQDKIIRCTNNKPLTTKQANSVEVFHIKKRRKQKNVTCKLLCQ
jgi:hypothetical protein